MPKVKTETPPPGSLPRNSNPERSMILARIAGQPVSEVVLDDQAVSLIRFEDAEPIRKFYAWPTGGSTTASTGPPRRAPMSSSRRCWSASSS